MNKDKIDNSMKNIIDWLSQKLYKYHYNKGLKLLKELYHCTETKKKVSLELKLIKNRDSNSIRRWLESSAFILVDDLEIAYANNCSISDAENALYPSTIIDSDWYCTPKNRRYFEDRFLLLLEDSEEEINVPRPFGLDFPKELQALDVLLNVPSIDNKYEILKVLENKFTPPLAFYGYNMLNSDCLIQRNDKFQLIISNIKKFPENKQLVYVKYLLAWNLLQEERELLENYSLNICQFEEWHTSGIINYYISSSKANKEKISNFLIEATDEKFVDRREWIFKLLLRSDRYKFHGQHGNSKEFNGFKLKLTDQLERALVENISINNAYFVASLLSCYSPINKKLLEEAMATVEEYYDRNNHYRLTKWSPVE